MLARMMNDWSPLVRLHNEMNRLLEDFFEDLPAPRAFAADYPAVNLWDEGERAFVETELPGLGMEDIEVLVTGNELTIKGERRIAEQPEASYHRRERADGRFARTLTLPWEIDADKVEARLSDGVLTITLPKAESCRPKKVKLLSA